MSSSENRGTASARKWMFTTVALAMFSWVQMFAAEKPPTVGCELCGNLFTGAIYSDIDEVTKEKMWMCHSCAGFVNDCFACGLPVPPDSMELDDGRHYCTRDGKTALTDPRDIQVAVAETTHHLRLALNRFMTFPKDNVDMAVMDRVNIQTMRTTPGADYSCPNLQGLYQTITNNAGSRKHSIRILTGLDSGNTRAVVAHELTHAWVADNVPEERKFSGDAEEGFCELVAYLVAENMNDHRSMQRIEDNGYTRGQFALFLKAKQLHEMQTLLDWVMYGEESSIDANDMNHVRRVTKPTRPGPKLWVNYAPSSNPIKAGEKPIGPPVLQLKGILGEGKRRLAMISGKSFMVGEQGNVKLGDEKVEIRCLEIGATFARVERIDTGEITELKLEQK